MQYPFYVHRTGDTSFRASFPDFPRAVAHGESMDELKTDAKLTSQAVGIQVNLLDTLLQQVDLAARERHVTRSAFITLAVVRELASRYEGQLSCLPVSQPGFVTDVVFDATPSEN